MASVTPEGIKDQGLSNFDRLRTHLAAGSVAMHLLDCWLADRTKETSQLLADLETYYDSKEASVAAKHQED